MTVAAAAAAVVERRGRRSAAGDAGAAGPRRHRDDLQGLRAVAVLIVAAAHAGIPHVGGGYVGVDVFFVLSGFLITGLLIGRTLDNGRVAFGDFYARRARRIVPAATLTLLVTSVVAWQLLNFVRAKEVLIDSTWAAAFSANIWFAHHGTDYFAQGQPPSAIQHYWSLSVEEQFYLVWPALLSLVLFGALSSRSRRHRARDLSGRMKRRVPVLLAIISACSLGYSVYFTHTSRAAAYFSTFARVWELGLGALLAAAAFAIRGRTAPNPTVLAIGRAAAAVAGIAMIAVATVTFSPGTPFPGYAALLPTVGAALVIASGIGRAAPGVGHILSTTPLRYIGDRSYAFYLWHWPALVIAELYAGHALSTSQNVLLLVLAFAVSIVSYRFVEAPIHQARWAPSPSLVLWPCSLAVITLVAALGVASADSKAGAIEAAAAAAQITGAPTTPSAVTSLGSPQATGGALPAVATAVAAARRAAPIPAALDPPVDKLIDSTYSGPAACSAHDGQTSSSLCRMGDTRSARTIVVFGDSHAEMWMPAILAAAGRLRYAVVPLSKSACTPRQWSGGGECGAWYRWAVQKAKGLKPTVTLVTGCCGSFSGDDAAAVKNAFVSFARAMRGSTRRTIAVADDVGIDQQPTDCLLARHATMRRCTSTWAPDRFALNEDVAAVAKLNHFGFIDTRGWFCAENSCPMVVGNTIVYSDLGHITAQYASQLATPFQRAFTRALG